MKESTPAVTSATPASSSASSPGVTGVAPVPAIVAQVTPSVDGATPPPVKLSRSQKSAANVASSSRLAAQPVLSSQTMTDITQPSIALSPGVADLSPADRAKLFMGKQLETATTEEKKEETEDSTDAETEVTAETETETETEQSEETETETETETQSRLTGITKELKDKGVSPKLIKRFEDLAKQNSERGELLKRQDTKPLLVEAPTQSNPLANVVDEVKIDETVKAMQADARTALRKLQRMDGVGGTWDEGGENERELTAADVDAWITYFEDLRDNAATVGQERKLYLKTYAEAAEAIGKPASELISPKVETRESKMIRKVPELMRDPEYLRFLADAQVGREMREKKASGVQTITIDPKAKKAESGTVTTKATTSTATATAAKTTPKVVSPNADMSMADLRAKAASGNAEAQREIRRRFMQPA